MILTNYYWSFPNVLDDTLVDQIIKEGRLEDSEEAGTFNKKQKGGENATDGYIRDTKVAWLDKEWLYVMLHPYVGNAYVNAGWNFDINFVESMQYAEYSPGQFYNWHQDSSSTPYDETALIEGSIGKIRKLSSTVFLSEQDKDYTGGDFVFDFGPYEDNRYHTVKENGKGSIIVFPSFIYHKITPVETGTRKSLVSWICGPPWR